MTWTRRTGALVALVVLLAAAVVGVVLARNDGERAAGPGAPTSSRAPSAPTSPSSAAASPAPPSASSPTPVAAGTGFAFTVSSFNVLGSTHTGPGGGSAFRASGVTRAGYVARILRRHGTDVVGFQELQRDQLLTLRELTDLELYPGSELRTGAGQNSVAWDPRVWTAVEKRVVEVPYFRGRPTPMPYVRLRSVATGAEAWVVNVHNPASIRRHPRQQRFRDRATSIEIGLVNRLVEDTRLPVLLVGDMNAKDDYFCRLTASAPVTAARGGSNEGGVCRPDDPQAVDWIFGTRDVRFSDYREDRSPLVYRTTDHAVVVARAEIPVSR